MFGEDLVSADLNETFKFFHRNLRVFRRRQTPDKRELDYVASILAHFANSSVTTSEGVTQLLDLSELFDSYVANGDHYRDPQLLENAAAMGLFLNGFFRDQMERRHNVRWYDKMSSRLYFRASCVTRDSKRSLFLAQFSEHSPYWALVCRDLSRDLRDNRYILSLNTHQEPQS